MRTPSLVHVPLALVAALAIASCGGGDSTTSTASTTASSTTSTTTTDADAAASQALGVSVTTATTGEPGVVVQSVPADSKIGLRAGDVIVALNGEPVKSTQELADRLGQPGLGDDFTLKVVRGSHRFTLNVVPSPTAYLAAKIATAPGGDGVAVAAIAAGGAADRAGVRPGDIIIAIDGTPTKTADALIRELAKRRPGDTVELTIERGNKRLKLTATLDERPATVPD